MKKWIIIPIIVAILVGCEETDNLKNYINKIAQLEKANQDLEKANQKLEKTKKDLEKAMKDLEQSVDNLKKENGDLMRENEERINKFFLMYQKK